MFSSKHFKKLIRARCSRTNERYVVARRHVVRAFLTELFHGQGELHRYRDPARALQSFVGWSRGTHLEAGEMMTPWIDDQGELILELSWGLEFVVLRGTSAASIAQQVIDLRGPSLSKVCKSALEAVAKLEQRVLNAMPSFQLTENSIKVRPFTWSFSDYEGKHITTVQGRLQDEKLIVSGFGREVVVRPSSSGCDHRGPFVLLAEMRLELPRGFHFVVKLEDDDDLGRGGCVGFTRPSIRPPISSEFLAANGIDPDRTNFVMAPGKYEALVYFGPDGDPDGASAVLPALLSVLPSDHRLLN